MKKGTAILVAMIIAVSIIFALYYNLKWTFDRSVDGQSGEDHISGLRDVVSIRRDRLGVPFIDAKSEEDLFFATGWMTAQDRLWQMTTMKMAMQGRLSEVSGKEFMKIDLFMRSLGVGEALSMALETMDPASITMLDAFSRGVNAYVDSHGSLPAEFFLTGYRPEPWRPIDSMYVLAMLSLNLSFNIIEELDFLNIAARVGYEKAAYLVPVYPDEELPFEEAVKLSDIDPRQLNLIAGNWDTLRGDLRGVITIGVPASNNWALSGSKTKSGRPIVCNDTHLALLMPNAWFMLHQKCPSYEAAGITAPGLPLVALGYNGNVAWGATMVMADNQDIFVEKLKEIDGRTHYLYRVEWVPASVRKETFIVRGDEPVVREIKSTIHGALMNDALSKMPLPPEMPIQPLPVDTKYGLALSWGVRNAGKTLTGFREIGISENAREARTAVLGMESAFLNIVYGDREGIGWQVSGGLPLRK
ncbi:MAG: penicillin acylase family protein [Chrysiogenales bacterium]|nr:MAG: penicillin acylase family protein [Chrysiogenales bacterium]